MKLAMRPIKQHNFFTLKDQHEELSLAAVRELISACIVSPNENEGYKEHHNLSVLKFNCSRESEINSKSSIVYTSHIFRTADSLNYADL